LLDSIAGGFFRDAKHDQENCLIRPRYDGYVPLQELAGIPLQKYMRGELSASLCWQEINASYRISRGLRR
jgi:hypothetical protein